MINFKKQIPVITSSILAFFLYFNTLDAEFVYDDSRAIITNHDLRPETPWMNLLTNDFWGTPLRHSGSHKSYRPLTVATFRFNYYFNELRPFWYHLINIILHTIITSLVTWFSSYLSKHEPIIVWYSGLMFASHPIHTEVVSGVVGRADLLTTLCFLLCLKTYTVIIHEEDEKQIRNLKSILRLFLCLFWATLAVLAKEHGFTVLGVCLIYDLTLKSIDFEESNIISPDQNQNRPLSITKIKRSEQLHTSNTWWWMVLEWFIIRYKNVKTRATTWIYIRWSILTIYSIFIIFIRFWLMNFSAPSFSSSDNPAAHSTDFLTRFLTFTYLIYFNLQLLLCPITLSFDWSMDSIPLLESIYDYRNLFTVIAFVIIIYLFFYSILKITSSINSQSKYKQFVDMNGNAYSSDTHYGTPLCSMFYVLYSKCSKHLDGNTSTESVARETKDFISARDRSLAVPVESKSTNHCASPCTVPKCVSYKSKFKGKNLDLNTINENYENKTLYLALLISIISFLPASNTLFYVGFVVAERILYLPSIGYCLIISTGLRRAWLLCKNKFSRILFFTICSLTILVFSCKTINRNNDWMNEERLYTSGINVNAAKAYSNLGNVYVKQKRIDDAIRAYKAALIKRPNMADTYYNYAILLQEKHHWNGAVRAYQSAIQCRPNMALAYLNMGIALTALQKLQESEKSYRICAELSTEGLKDPKTHENAQLSCLYNLGRLYADQKRSQDAVNAYELAMNRLNPYYQSHSLYNAYGDALSKIGHFEEAELAFKQSLTIKPDHVPAHLTYGHLLAKLARKNEAKDMFIKATKLAPNDSSTWQHLAQFYMDEDEYTKACEAYETAWRMNNNFDITFGLANVYRNQGKNDLAEEFYQKAVRLEPKSANAHMNFGAILHLNKKWKEAEKEYLLALQINPEDELTKENLRKLRRTMSKNFEN